MQGQGGHGKETGGLQKSPPLGATKLVAASTVQRLSTACAPAAGPFRDHVLQGPHGLRLDAIRFNAVAASLHRKSQWRCAIDVLLQKLWHSELRGTVVTRNILISAYAAGVLWRPALCRLEMPQRSSGFVGRHVGEHDDDRNDAVACGAAVAACSKASRWESAEFLLAGMRFVGPRLDVVTLGAAVSASERMQLWARSVAIGIDLLRSTNIQSSHVICNALLSSCSKGWHWARAAFVLARMWRCGPRPDLVACSSLAAGMGHDFRWECAIGLLSEFTVSGAAPVADNAQFAVCLNVLVIACGRALQWEIATNFFPMDPGVSALSAMVTACDRASVVWPLELALISRIQRLGVSDGVAVAASLCALPAPSAGMPDSWPLAFTMMLNAPSSQAAYSQEVGTGIFNAAAAVCERERKWQPAMAMLTGFQTSTRFLQLRVAPSVEGYGSVVRACGASSPESWLFAVAALSCMQRQRIPDPEGAVWSGCQWAHEAEEALRLGEVAAYRRDGLR